MERWVPCRCGHPGDFVQHITDTLAAWVHAKPQHSYSILALNNNFSTAHGKEARDLLLSTQCGPVLSSQDGKTLQLGPAPQAVSKPNVSFRKCGCGVTGDADTILNHVREAALQIIRKAPIPFVSALFGSRMGAQHGTQANKLLRSEPCSMEIPSDLLSGPPPPFAWKTEGEGVTLEVLSKATQPLTRDEATSVLQKLLEWQEVAVDLEGDLEEGEISLLQLAVLPPGSETALTFLIDGLNLTPDMLKVLKELMTTKSVEKVFHDCRSDVFALSRSLSIVPEPIFDTSSFYDMVVQMKDGTKPVGKTGLNRLLTLAGLPINEHKSTINHKESDGSNAWSQRPLSPQMQEYARGDVLYLLQLRTWLKEEMVKATLTRMSKESQEFLSPESIVNGPVLYEVMPLDYPVEVKDFLESVEQQQTEEDFRSTFLALFTASIAVLIEDATEELQMEEVVIEEGSEIYVRVSHGPALVLPYTITPKDIIDLLDLLNDGEPVPWSEDGRYCLPGSLHRVARLKAIDDEIVSLTYRLGRHKTSATHLLGDVLHQLAQELQAGGSRANSLLLLGQPGAGKTTILRQMAALLGEVVQKQVIVVDTSLEIAGGGHKAHPCIGQARRVQVKSRTAQHKCLVEVVQNHSPKVVIVDEVATKQEALAIKNIGQRGVAVVATAHGFQLSDLMKNHDLVPMLGGIHAVLLSASEAKARDTAQKTVLERKGGCAFNILVEIVSYTEVYVIKDLTKAIDQELRHSCIVREHRWLDNETGQLMCSHVSHREV